MPKITPSALISEIKGLWNGTVFQMWKGQIVTRNFNPGSTINKESRQQYKGVVSDLSGCYYSLSDSQKNDWICYSDLLPTQMSGFNSFMARNSTLMLADHPSLCFSVVAPPSYSPPATPAPFSVSYHSSNTWSDLGQQFAQSHIYSLAYLDSGIALAGTATTGKILRSTDYGASWSDLGQQFAQTEIWSLAYLDSGIALAGTYPGGKILRSTDYGASWSDLGQQFAQSHIRSLAYLENGIALAGTYPGGKILRSTKHFKLAWTSPALSTLFAQGFFAPLAGYDSKSSPAFRLISSVNSTLLALTLNASPYQSNQVIYFKVRTINQYGEPSAFSSILSTQKT